MKIKYQIVLIGYNATLHTKATEIENKISGITRFITTPECNGFAKINFDARTKEAVKSLVSKSQVDTAFDTVDKNKMKYRNKTLQTFEVTRSCIDDEESQSC